MNWLDKVIAGVSPEAALKREQARMMLRKYAGAKQSPQTGYLTQTPTTQNTELTQSWSALTARTAQLVRDYPPFASAVSHMEDFVIGSGIRFQSAVTFANGKADKKTQKLIEDAWNRFAESTMFDAGGRMSFYDFQCLNARQQMEAGEFMSRKHMRQGKLPRGAKSRFSVAALDPTQMTDGEMRSNDRSVCIAGVQVNKNTLSAEKYFFKKGDEQNYYQTSLESYNADEIFHGFHVLRPNQVRGVTPFASAIILAFHLQDYIQAEITAQKANSKFLAFVTASGGQYGTFNNATYHETFNKYSEALEYCTIKFLEPGEQVNINNTQRSGQGVQDFTKLILQMTAATVKCPYEVLSQDYSGMNYTTIRAKRNDFLQGLKGEWRRMITQFCRPVFDEWLKIEVLEGRLQLKGYDQDPERFHRGFFIPQGIEQVDPVKETQALSLKVRNGFMSPQQAIIQMGNDPERVMEEIAEYKDNLEKTGLEALWFVNGGGFPLIDNPDQDMTNDINDSSDI